MTRVFGFVPAKVNLDEPVHWTRSWDGGESAWMQGQLVDETSGEGAREAAFGEDGGLGK